MQMICLLKTTVKKMIDKFLYKFFGGLDYLIIKIGVITDEGYKAIRKLFEKRKRKKSK